MLPNNEPRISVKAMCNDPRLARDGRPLGYGSGYRYLLEGVLGHDGKKYKIEYERGPRGYVTSPQAIGRFLAALNGYSEGQQSPVSTTTSYSTPKRPSGAASKALAAAGCDAIGI